MIIRSEHFCLGQDRTRIKDPRDGQRQTRTVDELLYRMYNDDPDERCEIQILADEVGMGKTFVALGAAYSVLAGMGPERTPESLRGCYRKVLIITPKNSALFEKWNREVGEFVKRCAFPQHRDLARRQFRSKRVERLDDFASACNLSKSARVIVTNFGLFYNTKFRNDDLKRRIVLGLLFRVWGNSFSKDARLRLLRGAPAGWPRNPNELLQLTEKDLKRLSIVPDELRLAIAQLYAREQRVGSGPILDLLETCKNIATPYVRNRDVLFRKVDQELIVVYRAICMSFIRRDFPLVIVDEAHNWKNGPSDGANGYRGFEKLIGRRTRTALLLTATPFQLRPDEILEILKISDSMAYSPTKEGRIRRKEALRTLRDQVVRPVLDNSSRASQNFLCAWSKLPAAVTRNTLSSIWDSPELITARQELDQEADFKGVVEPTRINRSPKERR
ncbi:MAG: hypothetical protein IPI34_07095 [bacterium]|nr:hypothetical protein [bacterium]